MVLPVDNITAERLAEYFCGQLIEALGEHEHQQLVTLTVGIEEAPGQTGFYRHKF
jgi:6-pyruvoyltetrahydropterin/6-carboxytetrahydropterin synthase